MSTLKQDHVDSQLMQTPDCLFEFGFGDAALAAQLNALERHNVTLMGGGYVPTHPCSSVVPISGGCGWCWIFACASSSQFP
jgi:hypothetical protein